VTRQSEADQERITALETAQASIVTRLDGLEVSVGSALRTLDGIREAISKLSVSQSSGWKPGQVISTCIGLAAVLGTGAVSLMGMYFNGASKDQVHALEIRQALTEQEITLLWQPPKPNQ